MSRPIVLAVILAISCSSNIGDVSGFGVSTSYNAFGTTHSQHEQQRHVSSTALGMAQKRGRPKGPLRTLEVKPPMNREIRYDTLRVTTPSPKGKDETLGIMSKAEALEKAKELGGLDLILINENSDPPVCKIVDYSKYRYMKEKKAKERKKNSKATEVKEVKMSYKIDVHDYDVRKKNAAKFIAQGNRVKCTVQFKGREIQHDKLGVELLHKLALDLDKICNMESKPKREGRTLFCFISPKPEVVKAINDAKRAGEKAAKKKKEASFQALKDEKAQATTATISKDPLNDDSLSLDEILGSITSGDEGDDADDASLDELLGGDDLTDDLFG